MAAILIVEDDGLVARHMARTLRQSGHTPILAPDGRSALQEATDCPDIVLLDLGLPDMQGEEVLRRLRSQPETAHIPVLVVTGRTEAAARLGTEGKGSVAEILLKPVSGAQLRQAVDAALATQQQEGTEYGSLSRQRQRELIQRLLLEGPDALVFHVYRRIRADRTRFRSAMSEDVLTWTEIAEWARQEKLIDAEQARLLRRLPLTAPLEEREGTA
jgi:DNA-binding response OmpR family regulator